MNRQNNSSNLFLQQFFNNPLFIQAQKMAQGKDSSQIEQIAKNLCAERGLNYNEVLSTFQNYMKGFFK